MFPVPRFTHPHSAVFHRTTAALLLLLLPIAWLCGPALTASAQEIVPLYDQNFDGGFPNDWEINSIDGGRWVVEGGRLTGSGHVFAEYLQQNWGEGPHTLEFDLADLSVGGGLHVNVQHSEIGRYIITFERFDDSHLYIAVERNIWNQPPEGPMSDNDGQPFVYPYGQSYTVRIDFGDGHLAVFVGSDKNLQNLAVVSAQDPDPLPPGGISFESLRAAQVVLDNLVVSGPRPAPMIVTTAAPPPRIVTTAPPQPHGKAPAYRQCDGEKLLYAEDFNDGQAQDWKLETGWSVKDGQLQGKGHAWARYSDETWEDLTYYATIGLREGRGGLHISARNGPAGRYFVYLHPWAFGLAKQIDWASGASETFGHVEKELDVTVWHTLALAAHGKRIEVALDGVQQISVRDSNALPQGGIAFETIDDGFALIDAVWVCGTQPEAVAPVPAVVTTTFKHEPLVKTTVAPKPPAAAELPDLSVKAIQNEGYDPASRTLRLMLAATNSGNGAAGPFRIRLQESGWISGSDYLVDGLQPGETKRIWVELQISERLVDHSATYQAVADPDNQVRESDEQNNRLVSDPISFPSKPRPRNWWWIVVLVPTVAVIVWITRRMLRKPRQPEPERSREPHNVPPILPPARLLDVWITEGSSGKGPRIREGQPLVSEKEYCLQAQVLSTEAHKQGRRRPAETSLPVPLKVVVFSPKTDFPIVDTAKDLCLPQEGGCDPVAWPFRAGKPGAGRARVSLYYGNVLLQSAFIDAQVVAKMSRSAIPKQPAALRGMLDYVASASLTGLELLPQPSVSIFTNQATGGDSWIGVYAGGDPISGFSHGLLHTVSTDRLNTRAGLLRRNLLEIEETYQYTGASPTPRPLDARLAQLEQDLAEMACAGWVLYDELFLGSSQASKERKLLFDKALRPAGLIAISRCWSEKTTLPWAAVYDIEIDPNKKDLLRLCPIFRAELEGHWPDEAGQYRAQADWLDNPDGCRANPRCPLNVKDEVLTICPMGFWGFRHQISQPLQAVQPTPSGQVPQEVARAGGENGGWRFDKTIFLHRQPSERIRLVVGVHPALEQAVQLPVDLIALRPAELDIRYDDTRDGVLELLKQGGFHMYILYCHGEQDEREQKFKLVFGPAREERSISSENLNPLKINWPEQPQPLVVLNGCDTVAVTPETVHGLLERLHELGASGVVGTEIQVYPSLAYPFALELIERLLCGQSLGEAFLAQRRDLLRKFTPLGLAYTYHAPAALHLHAEGNCRWCAAHGLPAGKTGQTQTRLRA